MCSLRGNKNARLTQIMAIELLTHSIGVGVGAEGRPKSPPNVESQLLVAD